MEHLEKVMMLIANSGEARSKAMEAIQKAKKKEIEQAYSLLDEAKLASKAAHKIQTKLLQEEAGGNKPEVSMLLIHAQDHLMNGLTVLALAEEFVEMYESVQNPAKQY